MDLPSLKRLTKQNTPEEILVVLNNFMQTVFSILNKGITIQDNFQTQEFETKVNGSRPTLSFPCTLQRPAKMVFVAQVRGTAPLTAVVPNWRQIGTTLEITNITGLSAGVDYRIRFLVL